VVLIALAPAPGLAMPVTLESGVGAAAAVAAAARIASPPLGYEVLPAAVPFPPRGSFGSSVASSPRSSSPSLTRTVSPVTRSGSPLSRPRSRPDLELEIAAVRQARSRSRSPTSLPISPPGTPPVRTEADERPTSPLLSPAHRLVTSPSTLETILESDDEEGAAEKYSQYARPDSARSLASPLSSASSGSHSPLTTAGSSAPFSNCSVPTIGPPPLLVRRPQMLRQSSLSLVLSAADVDDGSENAPAEAAPRAGVRRRSTVSGGPALAAAAAAAAAVAVAAGPSEVTAVRAGSEPIA